MDTDIDIDICGHSDEKKPHFSHMTSPLLTCKILALTCTCKHH